MKYIERGGMLVPKAEFAVVVVPGTYQSWLAAEILKELAGEDAVLILEDTARIPDGKVPVLVADGPFVRKRRNHLKMNDTLLRVGVVELIQDDVGLAGVPQGVTSDSGIIVIRRLAAPQLNERSLPQRLRDALRQAVRVCDQQLRREAYDQQCKNPHRKRRTHAWRERMAEST